MIGDLYNNCKSVIALVTSTLNTDTTTAGDIIDTQGFESAKVALVTGTVTAGNVDIAQVEESDDAGMAGATVIPAERIIGTTTAVTTANTVSELGFVATKRYVRVSVITAGTANLQATALVELGHPEVASIR